MSILLSEALRAAGVGALFLLIFALAEAWKRWGDPPAEWTRKAVHLGGGLVTLGLPWMVRSHWTVLALGVAFGGIIWGTRRLGMLRSVHCVERRSEGGLYFPLAVYLVFLLGQHRPVFYLISILALVLSDALAALVGTTYGRTSYSVEGDRRTVEGSLVFLLVTFLGVHLPLLLLTEVDRAASVLVAVQIALLVTLVEAVSLRGNDNLLVPLGTFYLLMEMTPRPASELLLHLGVILGILSGLFLAAWRSRMLTASGTLAATLFFYGAWVLGGPAWALVPALGLAAFWVVFRRWGGVGEPDARYQVLAVFYTGLVATALFVLRGGGEAWRDGAGEVLYPLYLGALAAHLAMLSLVFWEDDIWLARVRPTRWWGALVVGAGVIVPAGVWLQPGSTAEDALVAAGVCALALALYPWVARWRRWPRQRPWDARLQAACAAVAVVLLFPFLG